MARPARIVKKRTLWLPILQKSRLELVTGNHIEKPSAGPAFSGFAL
jgi:hypothetical protein